MDEIVALRNRYQSSTHSKSNQTTNNRMYQNDKPPYSADGVHHHDGDDVIDQADQTNQSAKSKSSNQKEKVA